MCNLVVDIGNSNIVLGVYGEEKKVFRFNTDANKTSDEYYTIFKNVLNDLEISNILIASVVPHLTSTIKYCFEKRFNKNVNVVEPGYKSGVKVKTDNPREVGSDLICGVAGAMANSKSGLVIDLGTATKISYYSNGTFLGVIIAPGIEISARTLTSSASQLSSFPLQKPEKVFGTNTMECLQSGIIYGHIAMLNGLIEMAFNEIGMEVDIYLTGGLSHIVKDELNYKVIYNKDLILDALNNMIKKNGEKV